MTAIRPAVHTVGVTVGLGGQWVRVTDQGAATIAILGYRGEPFLRLSHNRVQINQLSATAAQTGLTLGTPAPENRAVEPRWVHLRDGDSVAWTDTRVSPPPDTAPASGSWELPLVVNGQQVSVIGTREWIPPASPGPWMAVLVLLIAAVAAIGWRRNWHRPMAYVVATATLAFVLHVLGTAFAPQQSGPVVGWVSVALVAGFSVVIGAIGLLSTVRRSESAPDRLVVVGATVSRRWPPQISACCGTLSCPSPARPSWIAP